jgi:molybdopterin-guanine dinucleotide biosynthesis protein A
MGRDKAQIVVDGVTLAQRTASLLELVVTTAIEVGPGRTSLSTTREDPPGEGPLAGIAAGWRLLSAGGHDGPALVVACDLPFLTEALLRLLVTYDAPGTLVPVVEGRAQPLCARWASRELDEAHDLVTRGVRSLAHLETRDVTRLESGAWGAVATSENFRDVDTPGDLARYGLASFVPR